MGRYLSLICLVICGTCAISNANADTICIKNKAGVEEAWTTDAKGAGLIKTSDKCDLEKGLHSSTPDKQKPSVANQSGQVVTPPSSGLVGSTSSEAPQVKTAATIQTWIASRNDQNMRVLLDKWSKEVGWTLLWAVDKDIPMESSGTFSGNFKTAVRLLLASTELSDFTIKPCFYTNNVVRVVKETTKCNPNEG